MAPIKSKLTPEQQAQKLAYWEELRAADARMAEQEQARAARERAYAKACAEASHIVMTHTRMLSYANQAKESKTRVEVGEVYPVELWSGNSWVIRHPDGLRVVKAADASPCGAETKNDLERADAPASTSAEVPPAVLEAPEAHAVEAAESPMAAVKVEAAPMAAAPIKAARAAARERVAVDEGEWYRQKRAAIRRAALRAGCGAVELAVLEELADPCGPEQWPVVWRSREDIAEALGLSDGSVKDAITRIKGRGLLTVKTIGHRNKATEYHANIAL